jgi:hypothetical protein
MENLSQYPGTSETVPETQHVMLSFIVCMNMVLQEGSEWYTAYSRELMRTTKWHGIITYVSN